MKIHFSRTAQSRPSAPPPRHTFFRPHAPPFHELNQTKIPYSKKTRLYGTVWVGGAEREQSQEQASTVQQCHLCSG